MRYFRSREGGQSGPMLFSCNATCYYCLDFTKEEAGRVSPLASHLLNPFCRVKKKEERKKSWLLLATCPSLVHYVRLKDSTSAFHHRKELVDRKEERYCCTMGDLEFVKFVT